MYSPQVLLSLRLLLMMKPHVLSRVSREVAYGLHELLKTNAANIHSTEDWYTLFSLLECIGTGVKPPAALQFANTNPDNDTGDSSNSHVFPTILSVSVPQDAVECGVKFLFQIGLSCVILLFQVRSQIVNSAHIIRVKLVLTGDTRLTQRFTTSMANPEYPDQLLMWM